MNFWEGQRCFALLYDKSVECIRKKYGLSRTELDVLMFLRNHPQYTTAAQVARLRKIAKSQVSEAVVGLTELGLLVASRRDGNKKSVFLTLTSEGISASDDGRAAQQNFGKMLLKGFSFEEIEALSNYMSRVFENAERCLTEVSICG